MSRTKVISYLKNVIKEELNSNPSGILLSKREMLLGSQLDDNLFFTLSGFFLFRNEDSELKGILKKSCSSSLEFYKNKEGRASYNFWKTKPYRQYPNSTFLSRIKHFWVPDDLDCSILSQLISNNDDDLIELRKISELFVTSKERKVDSCTLPKGTYTTWFGHKMKEEVDLCVIANYLTVLGERNVSLCNADLIALNAIKNCLDLTLIEKHSFELSTNYQKPSIIAFHIARCMSVLSEEFSEKETKRFKEQLINKLDASGSTADRVMYTLALQELSFSVESDFSEKQIVKYVEEFSFFKASMLANSKHKLAQFLKTRELFNVPFVCRGFNALILLKIFHSE